MRKASWDPLNTNNVMYHDSSILRKKIKLSLWKKPTNYILVSGEKMWSLKTAIFGLIFKKQLTRVSSICFLKYTKVLARCLGDLSSQTVETWGNPTWKKCRILVSSFISYHEVCASLEFLKTQDVKPCFWKIFIDDIFFIWNLGK